MCVCQEIRALDKEMRAWDAFSGLDSTVKNMVTSLRAVGELQNKAIRDRHWEQLMQATQVLCVLYTTGSLSLFLSHTHSLSFSLTFFLRLSEHTIKQISQVLCTLVIRNFSTRTKLKSYLNQKVKSSFNENTDPGPGKSSIVFPRSLSNYR